MRSGRAATRGASVVAAATGLAMLAGASGACDAGKASVDPSHGAVVHLVAANVGPGKPLPANGIIQLAFDRPLDPTTVVRQSVNVVDSFYTVAATPVLLYDPVAKVITIASPEADGGAWLQPDQPYTLRLFAPDVDAGTTGLLAIDGAPPDPASMAPIGFNVVAATGAAPREPPIVFCRDVMPVLAARCGGSSCHGGAVSASARPAEGLLLDSPAGIAATAIDVVATGANTGPRAGWVQTSPGVFGTDSAIVRAGDPATSWLLYKVLMAPPAAEATAVNAAPRASTACANVATPVAIAPLSTVAPVPWSDDDRATLGRIILGAPMPYPAAVAIAALDGGPSAHGNLTLAEQQRLRAWITQGAEVTSCPACP